MCVFDKIEVAFHPVGDNNSDIHQELRTTAKRLETYNAIIWNGLHEKYWKCYNDWTIITIIKNCAIWSGLCDQAGVIAAMHQITAYRFFKFRRQGGGSHQDAPVVCLVKLKTNVTWTSIHNGKKKDMFCFLTALPDLGATPPEQLTAPNEMEQVTALTLSEHSRIHKADEHQDLLQLLYEVYRTRQVSSHWMIDHNLECGSRQDEDIDFEKAAATTFDVEGGMQKSQHSYDVGSFGAVHPHDKDYPLRFWIGNVVEASCR